MATKPPAKAAPKSSGKAAAKPAAKTPAKKPAAKPAAAKPEPKKRELPKVNVPNIKAEQPDDLPWEEDPQATAEAQAELDDLTSMLASARADITPQDTERSEPAPVVPKPAPVYKEAVKVDYSPRPTPNGTLRMSDVRSAWNRDQSKQPASTAGARFKLR